LPTGIFSDYIGRRKSIAIGALAIIFAISFYAIGHSYWILVIGAILEGLSTAFYNGNNDALLYDTLRQEGKTADYHRVLGKTSAMFQVGLAVAAVLGGFIASWSFIVLMWISVIPQILCFLISLKFAEPPQIKRTKNIYEHVFTASKLFIHNIQLRRLSLSSILSFALGESSFQFQAAFYAMVWPIWAIGIAKTVSNVGAAISFHFSGKLIDKYHPIKWMLASNIYNRIANTVAVIFPSVFSPVLMSSTSIFFGVSSVAKNTLIQKEFTNEQRATMDSLNSLAGSIAFAIYAPMLGLVADRIGPANALIMTQILSISFLWLYWKIFKDTNKSTKTA
jgi:MFS family permease